MGIWELIGLIIFGCIIIYALFTGFRNLFYLPRYKFDEVYVNPVKNAIYEGKTTFISKKIFKRTHTVNEIPTGIEHYYILFSPSGKNAIFVRAPGKWNKYFKEPWFNQVSFQVTGNTHLMKDALKPNIIKYVEAFKKQGITLESEIYIDVISTKLYIMQIIVALLPCLFVLAGIFGILPNILFMPYVGLGLFLLWIGVFIYIISMAG